MSTDKTCLLFTLARAGNVNKSTLRRKATKKYGFDCRYRHIMSDVRKVSDSDAWALLALRESPVCKQTMKNMDASADTVRGITITEGTLPLARLEGNDFEYTMRKCRVIIGRSTYKDDVDVKVGHSTFVSRVHLEIFCVDVSVQRPKFYIKCYGKNGIFIDGVFHRKGSEAMQLPQMYTHNICIFLIFVFKVMHDMLTA